MSLAEDLKEVVQEFLQGFTTTEEIQEGIDTARNELDELRCDLTISGGKYVDEVFEQHKARACDLAVDLYKENLKS